MGLLGCWDSKTHLRATSQTFLPLTTLIKMASFNYPSSFRPLAASTVSAVSQLRRKMYLYPFYFTTGMHGERF